MSRERERLCVRPVGWDERDAALRLLSGSTLAEQSRFDELRSLVESGVVDLEGLHLATFDGVPIGAAIALIQPDGMAFAWPPEALIPPALRATLNEHLKAEEKLASLSSVESRGDDQLETRFKTFLLRHVGRWLDRCGVSYSQILLDLNSAVETELLTDAGFARLADLEIRQRSLLEPLPAAKMRAWKAFAYSDGAIADRFARMIDLSYLDSLDCPAFTGHRTGREALVSHRMSGEYDPARWLLFEEDGRDVGILLLTAHSAEKTWEIVYVGVPPENRGQGISRAMIIQGMQQAVGAGAARMCLCVDSSNRYAKAVYEELGLVVSGVRSVWIRWPAGRDFTNNPQEKHSGTDS